MLPRENRLKKKKEFDLTFKKGGVFESNVLEMRVLEEVNGNKKIGFVAPVKKFKKAAGRNKMKRKMREAAKVFLTDLTENVNIIFIAKKEAEERSVSNLREDVRKLLTKANILKNDR